jgi:hypothetical protein
MAGYVEAQAHPPVGAYRMYAARCQEAFATAAPAALSSWTAS